MGSSVNHVNEFFFIHDACSRSTLVRTVKRFDLQVGTNGRIQIVFARRYTAFMRIVEFWTSPSFNPAWMTVSHQHQRSESDRVPAWVTQPLGRYYLYFSHHKGTFIRLAYADDLKRPVENFTAPGYWTSQSRFLRQRTRPNRRRISVLGRSLRRLSLRSSPHRMCISTKKAGRCGCISWTAGQRRPRNPDSLL